MKMEKCRHGTRAPKKMLIGLPELQGGLGRHKCANCAYQLGISELEEKIENHGKIIPCAHENYAPEKLLLALSESQGGSGRHKCVICAYQEGRAAARGLSREAAWVPRKQGQRGSITVTERPTVPPAAQDEDWWKRDNERRKEIGDLGEVLVLEYEKTAKQICPDSWILNKMPISPPPGEEYRVLSREYFIVNGERRELIEFDVDWIEDNCGLEKAIVY